ASDGAQMAATFTNALDKEVHYNSMPPKVYRSFGFPRAEDLGNMFQFKHDFQAEFSGARDHEFSRFLTPALQTFKWLAENKSASRSSGTYPATRRFSARMADGQEFWL